MPSRRRFLATVGATAAAVGLAGCSASVGEPPAERWLYDPGTALGQPFPWQAYLSVDVPAAWERREQLPEEWVATATSFDRGVSSVDLADLRRVTALGFGTEGLTTMGTTVAFTGDIEPRPVVREFTRGSVTEYDPVADHRLFGYAPGFLARIQREDVTARGTLGLAVGEDRAVAGGLLAPEGEAVDAVAAMVRAGAAGESDTVTGADPDLRAVGRALNASPLEPPPVSGGVAFDEGLAERLAGAIPEEWPTLAATVDDLQAVGVGLRFAENATLTSFVFVYDPRSIAEDENLQAAVRKLTSESGSPDSGVVGVRLGPGGRSVVVRTTVSPQAVWTDFRDRLPGL
ncbi:twin-arginine translocation signal domain-containing protein [Haloglomus litoreum]|uniref:twin-arginine translocation signal domain-containing protein n=1 Tax=Haloglomus litoreum TaxID=3034026 RepID=UPI0023E8E026|nr:twin-arginine translocation signal domain-containing protein [Haloglomus sp. DT116]